METTTTTRTTDTLTAAYAAAHAVLVAELRNAQDKLDQFTPAEIDAGKAEALMVHLYAIEAEIDAVVSIRNNGSGALAWARS